MTQRGSILVTGGTGYIGSHAAVELLAEGFDVFIVDNLSNSRVSVVDRITEVAGRRPGFSVLDIRDREGLARLFAQHRFDAVIHFAGLKAVGESVAQPLRYYENNVGGTVCLLDAMRQSGVTTLVFSSSATVYGDPRAVPITEDSPLGATNPYGQSKVMVEQILNDLAASDPAWRIAALRYFNPAGAHPSGLIGEDPQGIPNNLLPYIARVAAGALPQLSVFGNDYPTPDGTGIRDYIHVVDLAKGHTAALRALSTAPNGLMALNLGTGRGYSVMEMIEAFAKASGRPIPYRIQGRRPGDVAVSYADPSRARQLLGWRASRGIEEMCADAWRWETYARRLAGAEDSRQPDHA